MYSSTRVTYVLRTVNYLYLHAIVLISTSTCVRLISNCTCLRITRVCSVPGQYMRTYNQSRSHPCPTSTSTLSLHYDLRLCADLPIEPAYTLYNCGKWHPLTAHSVVEAPTLFVFSLRAVTPWPTFSFQRPPTLILPPRPGGRAENI